LYQCTSLFSACNDRLMCIVDSDTLKQGSGWRGLQIHHPDILSLINWETTILLISSYGDQESIYADAVTKGVPEASIVRIYSYIYEY